uniref:Uncharacterized protein n=1 Tax=Peronospora matthiolae TaxID=2874970 RepID=A0AAV1TXH5_9STRA
MNGRVVIPSGLSDDNNTAQAPPTTVRARAAPLTLVVVPSHARARSAVNGALQKVMKMLHGMDERVNKMELS